jgi:uncharacterized metal-binding protein
MNWEEYPHAKKFLDETGMTLDEALIYTELELKKRGGNQ